MSKENKELIEAAIQNMKDRVSMEWRLAELEVAELRRLGANKSTIVAVRSFFNSRAAVGRVMIDVVEEEL